MIKTLFCQKCQKEVEIYLSDAGPHTKASCMECDAYIKFISQTELTGGDKMSEFEISVPVPNSQYGDVVIINKYGDQYSIVSGGSSKKGGTNYMKWCFPQGADKQPREKAVPWGIRIGNKNEAIEVVTGIAKAFGLKVVP